MIVCRNGAFRVSLCVLNWFILINIFGCVWMLHSNKMLSQDYVVRRIQERSLQDPNNSKNNYNNNNQLIGESSQQSQPTLEVFGNYEIAHVSFVTELRHKRDLSQNDYHIIKLFKQSDNKTIEIHLVKRETLVSSDFKVVIKNGDQIELDETVNNSSNNKTQRNCLYDGVITSQDDGKVAFSVCGKEPGFSGIIVTNDGNWIIEPQKDSSKGNTNDNDNDDAENLYTNGPSIPHIIVKVDSNSFENKHQSLMSDELHVPADELEKAAELAKTEAEANNNNNAYNVESDETNEDNNNHNYDDFDDNEEQEILLLLPNSNNNSNNTSDIKVESTATSSSKGSNSNVSNKKRRTNKRASSSDSNKRKTSRTFSSSTTTTTNNAKARAASSSSSAPTTTNSNGSSANKITVEIAVFTDDDFYEEMKIRYPKDTMRKIKDYVLTMIHSMDLLYQHESLGTDLHFKLVHLEIQKKRPSKLNSNGGKAKKYLTSFCDYAGDLNTYNNLWDHALMLTGHDLIEEGASSTAGLAWAGTMCYRYYSCSISEGTQFGSVFIITHEIGHSMGMEHDGMGVSKSCDENKYLMSPTTGPGKVTWSTCSGQNLKDFIKYGTSELRGGKSAVKPICMTESSREAKNIHYTSTMLPGQKYDANKQCALSMGKKHTPVMRKDSPFNNICSMLYCGNGTHAISTHPALDGTQCSTGKECQGGQCK